MTIAADRFRCLQQMLNLRKVGIRIAFIYQGIQVLRRLPDALFALLQF